MITLPDYGKKSTYPTQEIISWRWKYGQPLAGGERKQKDGSVVKVDGSNAHFAWIQHFVHHLSPNGIA